MNDNTYSFLSRFATDILLIPVDGGTFPERSTNSIFENENTREEWFAQNQGILDDGCEIIISVNENKMHAFNFDGVYRFHFYTEDGVTNIKLVTPVNVDTLLSTHFQKFLTEVNDYFVED